MLCTSSDCQHLFLVNLKGAAMKTFIAAILSMFFVPATLAFATPTSPAVPGMSPPPCVMAATVANPVKFYEITLTFRGSKSDVVGIRAGDLL